MNRKISHRSPCSTTAALLGAIIAIGLFNPLGLNAQSRLSSFSADQIRTIGGRSTTGKIYATDQGVRIEINQRGRQAINIVRFDRKIMWVLFPSERTYMEVDDIGSAVSDLSADTAGLKTEREAIGSEQVGPYHCDKYRVRVSYDGKVYTRVEWDARELHGFAVKKEAADGRWSTEYQNIRPGPQGASLFELPAGYRKMDVGNNAPR
jgi:hypothetical protein